MSLAKSRICEHLLQTVSRIPPETTRDVAQQIEIHRGSTDSQSSAAFSGEGQFIGSVPRLVAPGAIPVRDCAPSPGDSCDQRPRRLT